MILERRHRTQAPGEPRERRRPRWGEFRDAYPRIVAAMAVGLVAFLAIDGVLAFKRWQYGRETARLRGQMRGAGRGGADAIVGARENGSHLVAAPPGREGGGDKGLTPPSSAKKGAM